MKNLTIKKMSNLKQIKSLYLTICVNNTNVYISLKFINPLPEHLLDKNYIWEIETGSKVSFPVESKERG